ncbi:DUF2793 domain-containing protein [Sphingomonas adhaesiva]|uniref:DUF2793 domain-containing protein n=1 Tax=Sphingomonas adhaesiva TaxID=28212 RepID=UPI002FF7835E
MDDATARLALPLLEAGQAQKEIAHNEALAMLDIAVQAIVQAGPTDQPPAAPAIGACWIVGTAPQGAWVGQAGRVAGWTGTGWRFVVPQPGWCAWDAIARQEWRLTAAGWERGVVRAERVTIGDRQVVGARRPAIPDPLGGTTVDGEARAALAKVLDTLRQHGLIEP